MKRGVGVYLFSKKKRLKHARVSRVQQNNSNEQYFCSHNVSLQIHLSGTRVRWRSPFKNEGRGEIISLAIKWCEKL